MSCNDKDFSLARYSDGQITISIAPPTAIGGWAIQFDLTKRFGSDDPIVSKYVGSGTNATSGITITNSGLGILSVRMSPFEVSGMDPGNIAYRLLRTDSGFHSELVVGYRIMDF